MQTRMGKTGSVLRTYNNTPLVSVLVHLSHFTHHTVVFGHGAMTRIKSVDKILFFKFKKKTKLIYKEKYPHKYPTFSPVHKYVARAPEHHLA